MLVQLPHAHHQCSSGDCSCSTQQSHAGAKQKSPAKLQLAPGAPAKVTDGVQPAKPVDLGQQEVAMVMHDVKAPLSTIQLCLEIIEVLSRRTELDDQLERVLRRAQANVRQVQLLADKVLISEKLRSETISLELKPLDLKEVVSECIELVTALAHERNIEIHAENVDTKLVADRVRLSQIIQNLLANAINFAPLGSRVSISSSLCTIDNREYIRISIEDCGPGIPEFMREEIFQAYWQGSKSASGSGSYGLGLAICKKLVSMHGGRIWVDNRPGSGCLFHFALPAQLIVG